MSITTVVGQILRANNTPYAAGTELHFDLMAGSFTPTTQFTATRNTAILDVNGEFTIDLFANESGDTASFYRCITPDKKYFDFTIPESDDPIELSVLREGGITELDPQYQTLITYFNDQYALDPLLQNLLDDIDTATPLQIVRLSADKTRLEFGDGSAGGGGGSAIEWLTVSSDATLLVNKAYFVDSASLVQLTLPTSATLGDTIIVSNLNVGNFRVKQNSGQQIRLGDKLTTVGITGRLTSTDYGDSVELVYKGSNLWVGRAVQGHIDVA